MKILQFNGYETANHCDGDYIDRKKMWLPTSRTRR